MKSKRGHEWEGHPKGIKKCRLCGVEKWRADIYHIKPGNPLYSEDKNGVCVWRKEPPCHPTGGAKK